MNRKIKDALTLGIAAAFVLMFALWSICKSDDAVSGKRAPPAQAVSNAECGRSPLRALSVEL